MNEKTKNNLLFIVICWIVSAICYIPLIANGITNSWDGLWKTSYHQAGNWEFSIGRWAWPFLDKARMGYAGEPFNSLLTLLIMVIIAWLTISLFTEVEYKHFMHVLLVTVSTTTCCFLSYRFMSPTFAVSTLLSVLAAWVILKKDKEDKKQQRFIDGIVILLLTVSLGLYQANFGAFFVLIFASFLKNLVKDNEKKGFNLLIRSIISGLISCVLYKIIWEIFLRIRGIQAASYNGADSSLVTMVTNLPIGIAKAYLGWAFRRGLYGCNYIYKPVRWAIYLFIFGLLVYIGISRLKGKGKAMVLYFLTLLLMPVAADVCLLMAPGSPGIAMQMSAPLMISGIVVLCFVDLYAVNFRKLLIVFVAIILYGNIYCVGTDMDALNQGTRSMDAIMDKVVVSLIAEDAFDIDKEYVFLGDVSDNELFRKNELWDWASEYARGGEIWTNPDNLIESYGGMLEHLGIRLKLANRDTYEKYINNEEVRNMPTYPAKGSILTDGDQVVVKISNDY